MQLYTKEVNNELHQRNPELRTSHSFMSGAEKANGVVVRANLVRLVRLIGSPDENATEIQQASGIRIPVQ